MDNEPMEALNSCDTWGLRLCVTDVETENTAPVDEELPQIPVRRIETIINDLMKMTEFNTTTVGQKFNRFPELRNADQVRDYQGDFFSH